MLDRLWMCRREQKLIEEDPHHTGTAQSVDRMIARKLFYGRSLSEIVKKFHEKLPSWQRAGQPEPGEEQIVSSQAEQALH